MSKQTRLEIIRDFETQIVYARTAFPIGAKGLRLKDGVITPGREELQQQMALFGPAVKAGDPAHILMYRSRTTTFVLRLTAALFTARNGISTSRFKEPMAEGQ